MLKFEVIKRKKRLMNDFNNYKEKKNSFKVEEEIKIFFDMIRNDSVSLIEKNQELIYKNLIITLFEYDIENIPCFTKIKKEKVMGMDEEQLRKFHQYKFNKLYKVFRETFLREGEEELDKERLNLMMYNHSTKVKKILKSLAEFSEEFNLKEFVEFHRSIIDSIIIGYLNDLEITNEEKIKIKIRNSFIKIFGKHYGMLECYKII